MVTKHQITAHDIVHNPCMAGADQGLPVGGGADPLGVPTYDFVKFSQKLHEIEKILGRGGARAGGAPPLGSATAWLTVFLFL